MLFILLTVLSQAIAGLFMKYAAVSLEHFTLAGFISNFHVWVAVLILVVQFIFWQIVLRKHKLSTAYFFMSLRYFITLGFGYFLFQETVNHVHIIGLFVIVLGLMVFVKGSESV